MDGVGDLGGGGGVDGGAVDEEAVGFCGYGFGDWGQAGVENVAKDRFDVRRAGEDGDDDLLHRRTIVSCRIASLFKLRGQLKKEQDSGSEDWL